MAKLTNAEGGGHRLADQTGVVGQGEAVFDAPVADKVKVGGEEEAVHLVDLGQPDWRLWGLQHTAHLQTMFRYLQFKMVSTQHGIFS